MAKAATRLLDALETFDSESVGIVSSDGLHRIFKDVATDWNPRYWEILLRAVDADSSGQVNIRELVAWVFGASLDLAVIRSLRDAANAGDNVYWDFATCRALPGRTWHEHSPQPVIDEISRDMTDKELQRAREVCRIDRVAPVPESDQPEVLIVMGPSGAGKSMMLPLAARMFSADLGQFVHIDGDDLRACHGSWKQFIEDDPVHGYKDAYDIFTRNARNKQLKSLLSKECLRSRKNVVFPWTSIENDAYQLMKEAGYTIMVFGLMISREESDARQKNRAQVTGRWASTPTKKWQRTLDDLVRLCERGQSDRVLVYDSTDVLDLRLVHSRTPGVDDPDQLQQTIELLKFDGEHRAS